MEVDADDTGVLLILFLVNVVSLRHEEEKLLNMWGLFLKNPALSSYRRIRKRLRKLTTSPN